MNRRPLADAITEISVFAPLSDARLEALSKRMHRKQFSKGQTILHHQDADKDIYVLLDGRALAMLVSADGREMAFGDVTPVSYFGEIAAVDQGLRSANVYALDDCEVAILPWSIFNELLDTEPAVSRALLKDLAARVRTLTTRNFEMMTMKVETRVRAMIVSLALQANCLKPGGVLKPAPTHMDLAARVGSKREVVSRILSQLVSEGVIVTSRQSIEIIDLELLLEGLDSEE